MNNITLKQNTAFFGLVKTISTEKFWLKNMTDIALRVSKEINDVSAVDRDNYLSSIKAQLFILNRESVSQHFQYSSTNVHAKNHKEFKHLAQVLGFEGRFRPNDKATQIFYSLASNDLMQLKPYILKELKQQNITVLDLAHDALIDHYNFSKSFFYPFASEIIYELVKIKMSSGEKLDQKETKKLCKIMKIILGDKSNAYNVKSFLRSLIEGMRTSDQLDYQEMADFLNDEKNIDKDFAKELRETMSFKSTLNLIPLPINAEDLSSNPIKEVSAQQHSLGNQTRLKNIFSSDLSIALSEKNVESLLKEITVESVNAKRNVFKLKDNFKKIKLEIEFLESKKELLSMESQTECTVNFKQNVPQILSFVLSIPELSLDNREKSFEMMVESTGALLGQLNVYRQEAEFSMMKNLSAMTKHQVKKTLSMSQ